MGPVCRVTRLVDLSGDAGIHGRLLKLVPTTVSDVREIIIEAASEPDAVQVTIEAPAMPNKAFGIGD